jgi:diguanylate cyclase (GGDEF)-like protein/PAS domain S-box-containing protein
MPESQNEFKRLASITHDAYGCLDLEGRLLDVNPAFEVLTGYGRHELDQAGNLPRLLVHPDSAREFQATVERIATGGADEASLTVRLIRKDGRSAWVEAFIVPFADERRPVAGIHVIIKDVSQHLHVADMLSRRAEQQAVLLNVQRELLTQLDFERTLQSIVAQAQRLLNAHSCTIFLLQGDGVTLKPVAAAGREVQAMMDLILHAGEGVTGWVVDHGAAQLVTHSRLDTRSVYVPGTKDEDECLMVAPLQIGNSVAGALLLGGEPEQFCQEDLNFLIALAQVASLAIVNSQTYGDVKRKASIDEMTGAFNRNFLLPQLAKELARAEQLGYRIGLLFIDLDEFKQVNESFGHLAGDEVLRQVVAALRSRLRETDWLARYGGDEFAAVLPGCDQISLGYVGEKLRQVVMGAGCTVGQQQVHMTASIGGAVSEMGEGTGMELILRADRAEGEAKRQGGNRVIIEGENAAVQGNAASDG